MLYVEKAEATKGDFEERLSDFVWRVVGWGSFLLTIMCLFDAFVELLFTVHTGTFYTDWNDPQTLSICVFRSLTRCRVSEFESFDSFSSHRE